MRPRVGVGETGNAARGMTARRGPGRLVRKRGQGRTGLRRRRIARGPAVSSLRPPRPWPSRASCEVDGDDLERPIQPGGEVETPASSGADLLSAVLAPHVKRTRALPRAVEEFGSVCAGARFAPE